MRPRRVVPEKLVARRYGPRCASRIDAGGRSESEDEYQANILRLARLHRWLCYHTRDSRRSPKGFPDLVLVSARRRRVIFAELKGPNTTVTREQRAWAWALAAVGSAMGFEVYLWRSGVDRYDEIEGVLR